MDRHKITYTDNVKFDRISSFGFVLLSAFQECTIQFNRDLTITSGTDGQHSGPNDPHHLGRAFDVRSHDFDAVDKEAFIKAVLENADNLEEPVAQDGGFVTTNFFGWLESAGQSNEHFHFQARKGVE